MPSITVEQWDEEGFLGAETEWQALLGESDADPLFLSWHWMSSWWKIFRRADDRPCILAVYRGGQLIGLAPLYLHRAGYFRDWLPVWRLQFLGTRSGNDAGLRSEYLGFILHREWAAPAMKALLDHLQARCDWQEAHLQDVPQVHPMVQQLARLGQVRELTGQKAYSVATRGRFEDYLGQLGRNTRLKLFNRRKRLAALGTVELRKVRPEQIDSLVDALNHFDRERFGHDATMSSQARAQIHELQTAMPGLSVTEHSSLLYLDDRLLSVCINFKVAGRVYNMQLGYQQDFHKKISLGTLHLGHAIEAAFADPQVTCFDFLLGEGKNSDYKRHLATECLSASSWQVIRSPLLKTLFAVNDRGKRWLRRLSSS
jgi:hypothetical protein